MAYTERYVDAAAAGGGDGTTAATSGGTGAFTLAEAITHSATNTGQRYNIKVGTYANTTTSRTFNGVATTGARNIWRGYAATIGDLDADAASTLPLISFTTGQFVVTGAYQTFQNLRIEGARTSTQATWNSGATHNRILNCEIVNTNAASGSIAFTTSSGSSGTIQRSRIEATTTATSAGVGAASWNFVDNAVVGGAIGLALTIGGGVVMGNIFRGQTSHGLTSHGGGASGVTMYLRNSFDAPGGDGIRFTTLAATMPVYVAENLFSACGGYDISNASGADSSNVQRSGNAHWISGGTGAEFGFGDSTDLLAITLSANPFVDAAGDDLTLASSSLAYSASRGFRGETYETFPGAGAVLPDPSAGGGGSGSGSYFEG